MFLLLSRQHKCSNLSGKDEILVIAFTDFVRVCTFFSADFDFKETSAITFSFSFHLCQSFHYEVDEHIYVSNIYLDN